MSLVACSRPILISAKEVCARTSLSRASLYRLMTDGSFPRPVPLHGVRKAWVESEVDVWIASRIAARSVDAA
jgi:prophage regulatory protein